MEIRYKNNKLRKLLEDFSALERKYGKRQAVEIVSRLNEFEAAESLQDIWAIPQTRAHWLVGNWKGYFSVDIVHPLRIYSASENGNPSDIKTITIVRVIEILDPH